MKILIAGVVLGFIGYNLFFVYVRKKKAEADLLVKLAEAERVRLCSPYHRGDRGGG